MQKVSSREALLILYSEYKASPPPPSPTASLRMHYPTLLYTTLLLLLTRVSSYRPRVVDPLSHSLMLEEGRMVPAAPMCQDNWLYHNASCYWFSSTRKDFQPAMDSCAEKGAYLTDILSIEENTFIKSVLMVINPKDGTDYWAGAQREGGFHWNTGAPMLFTDFYQGANKGKPYLHLNYDNDFAWDTKNDRNDRDNRYICKKSL